MYYFYPYFIYIYIYIYIYCDGVKDHTTSELQQKNPRGWVLYKRCAGAKCGTRCCSANHSLYVLGAVDQCRALVLGQNGHTLLSGEGDRIALVTESSGDLSSGPLQWLLKAVPDESQLMPVYRWWGCAGVAPSLPAASLMSARNTRHTPPPPPKHCPGPAKQWGNWGWVGGEPWQTCESCPYTGESVGIGVSRHCPMSYDEVEVLERQEPPSHPCIGVLSPGHPL